jgi:hypothetical protein
MLRSSPPPSVTSSPPVWFRSGVLSVFDLEHESAKIFPVILAALDRQA